MHTNFSPVVIQCSRFALGIRVGIAKLWPCRKAWFVIQVYIMPVYISMCISMDVPWMAVLKSQHHFNLRHVVHSNDRGMPKTGRLLSLFFMIFDHRLEHLSTTLVPEITGGGGVNITPGDACSAGDPGGAQVNTLIYNGK